VSARHYKGVRPVSDLPTALLGFFSFSLGAAFFSWLLTVFEIQLFVFSLLSVLLSSLIELVSVFYLDSHSISSFKASLLQRKKFWKSEIQVAFAYESSLTSA
jgi:hypothetical protein